MEFVVITKIPLPGSRGNLASTFGQVFYDDGTDADPMPTLGDVLQKPILGLLLQTPVFTLGEVLICNGDGRELVGAGRKPSKWGVEYESFATAEKAVARAQEVTG